MDRATFPCPHCAFALPTWAIGNCPRCRRPLDQAAVSGSSPPASMTSAFTPYQPPAPVFQAQQHPYQWAPPAPPEPGRRMRRSLFMGLAGVAAVFVAFGVAGFALDRQDALASPARPLLQEPCARYRELTIRVTGDNSDPEVGAQIIQWFGANRATFAQAATLDPELADASAAVHGIHALFADPARIARTSEAEIDRIEAPLVRACFRGPGRA